MFSSESQVKVRSKGPNFSNLARDKISPFGEKLSYRLEILYTGWRLVSKQHVFPAFLIWKFWILGSINFFKHFRDQKT